MLSLFNFVLELAIEKGLAYQFFVFVLPYGLNVGYARPFSRQGLHTGKTD